jgi:hypothetical protein
MLPEELERRMVQQMRDVPAALSEKINLRRVFPLPCRAADRADVSQGSPDLSATSGSQMSSHRVILRAGASGLL